MAPTVLPRRAPAAKPAPTPKPGRASLLSDLPLGAPDGLTGWLVAVGAGLGTVAFILPWSERVIYAGASTGYLASWGLASPGHWLVCLATFATLGLSVVPTRLPDWIRDRIIAPILSGVLLGLGWPYLMGALSPRLGVVVLTLGALLLGTGAITAQRAARHAGEVPAV